MFACECDDFGAKQVALPAPDFAGSEGFDPGFESVDLEVGSMVENGVLDAACEEVEEGEFVA